jgi:hypothetical protein
MSVAAARPRGGLAVRALSERVLAILPLVTVYVWLVFLYSWESWGHVTPWLMHDELENTQLSRAIAESGEAARRGAAHSAGSVYPYLIAPVWWIDDTSTAYAAAKYVGVLVMTSALFPAYALARMVVGRPAALFAAAATASIPALYYSSLLLQEPLAYPFATLCAFLIAKALATRSRGWVVGAAAASLAAPFVREQLAVIPAAFVLAALALAWTSERGKQIRRGWTRWDWVGAITLITGAVIVVNAAISHVSYSWLISTLYFKDRMFENGLWAVGALTIGVGVLPVVVGLAALVRPRGEQMTPELRAFVATAAAFIVGFGWYTAVKASYISTAFSTLTLERNLIYVAPLLFVGTALFLERPLLRWWAVAGSAALALYVIVTTNYQMQIGLYADAPGFSIVQAANRNYGWTESRAQSVLIGLLVISLLVVVLPRVLPGGPRVIAGMLALVAAGVVAWNLTGQVSAASFSNSFAREIENDIAKPLDWIDRETRGEKAIYLGQKLSDYNGLWQMEFWNRSLQGVWSTDGTAPGPGPTLTPDVIAKDGSITQAGVNYVVTDPGVDLVGTQVARHEHSAAGTPRDWRLIRIVPPLRLQNSTRGVYHDGWAGRNVDYSQFTTPGNEAGFADVTISRRAWGGKDKPGKVEIKVGTLALGKDRQPKLGRVVSTCRFTLNRLEHRIFHLPSPPPPFHVQVSVKPTFSPAELDPSLWDTRQFGGQVMFSFSPMANVPAAQRGCAAGLRGPGR